MTKAKVLPRRLTSMIGLALVAVAPLTPAAAQFVTGPIIAPPDSQLPRPGANFEGTWKIATPRSSLLAAGVTPPLTAEGMKHYAANRRLKGQKAIDDYDIATTRCSNPGVPRLALNPRRFKIWQRQGVLTFVYEWNRALREIDMRGVATPPLEGPNMAGASVGRWDGATLVATTTQISARTLLDELLPHSDELKVTERFRLLDPDTLEDQITIEDPTYYSRPWVAVVTYKRQTDVLFPEDVCLDRLKDNDAAMAGR